MSGQRVRGGTALTAVLGLGVLLATRVAAPAAAAPRPDPRSTLTPIVECSASNDGVTKTIFGYDNSGTTAAVSVGPANSFSPGPADRGQPTRFMPGTRINVFTVSSAHDQRTRFTWTLGNRRVQSPGSTCASSPTSSTLAQWGPIGAIVMVTLLLGGLLFWRTRRLRVRAT